MSPAWAGQGPGVLERPDAQVARGHAGQHRARAAAVSRCTPRPVATTASDRVVGMPRACMASLTTYSRSIGPTDREPVAAARERRAAGALEVQVAQAAGGRGELAEQQRAAVAEPGRVAAELVAGVALGDRAGALGHAALPTRKRTPSSVRSHSGSRPSSTASGWLSTSSCGVRRGLGLPVERELGEVVGEAVGERDRQRRGGGRGGRSGHASNVLSAPRAPAAPGRRRPSSQVGCSKTKPASSSRPGTTRRLLSSSSGSRAQRPRAEPGHPRVAGSAGRRPHARRRIRARSRWGSGSGAARLTGPSISSCSTRNSTARTKSSAWIQRHVLPRRRRPARRARAAPATAGSRGRCRGRGSSPSPCAARPGGCAAGRPRPGRPPSAGRCARCTPSRAARRAPRRRSRRWPRRGAAARGGCASA